MNLYNKTGKTTAYCWATGLVEFTDGECPEGALVISRGTGKKWREAIEAQLRLGFSNDFYLVPGVPEANLEGIDPIEALLAFIRRLQLMDFRRMNTKSIKAVMGKVAS
jgi:hypothetical protein